MTYSFRATYQWQKARKLALERDEYQCQIRGPKCTGRATQVDHIIPVEDGGPLYDLDNLRAACRWCNNWRAVRQKAEMGWRRNKAKIILVVGPPAAGKSTYIRDRLGPRDLVIDYDAMAAAMYGASHKEISAVRNTLLRRVRRGEVEAETVWIHSANPRAETMFPHHEVVVLDPGKQTVLERAANTRPASFVALIENWYEQRQMSAAGQTNGLREW